MSKEATARLQREQAMAEVLKGFVPQLFSHPKQLTEGAEDAGGLDAWMLSLLPSEIVVPMTGMQIISEVDNRPEIGQWLHYILRTLKSVGGFTAKQGERIAIGMSGAGARKVVKRPGWGGRNISNRGWREKAEDEGAEIES